MYINFKKDNTLIKVSEVVAVYVKNDIVIIDIGLTVEYILENYKYNEVVSIIDDSLNSILHVLEV